jgi:hypothetical protein
MIMKNEWPAGPDSRQIGGEGLFSYLCPRFARKNKWLNEHKEKNFVYRQ